MSCCELPPGSPPLGFGLHLPPRGTPQTHRRAHAANTLPLKTAPRRARRSLCHLPEPPAAGAAMYAHMILYFLRDFSLPPATPGAAPAYGTVFFCCNSLRACVAVCVSARRG